MRNTCCLVLPLIAAVSACTTESRITEPPQIQAVVRPTLQYRIDPLPTSGDGLSQGGGINNQGLVAGFTGMSDGTRQAALWQNGVITPLGTLPGGSHSMVQWPGINNSGVIVGISRTGDAAPYGEAWSCSAFLPGKGKICLPFIWDNGVMAALPTLGGPNGFAAGVNSRVEVVGWAENTVFDGSCNTPQVLQFRGVLWEPRKGIKQELLPLAGDQTSAATAINDQGQVVGISGECDVAVGRKSAKHAVLWQNGTVEKLPDLGGDFWHTPMAVNSRGDVVGFGNPPGGDIDADDLRAFLWTRAGGITNLGKLDADGLSQAFDINTRGQIVGVSCGDACQAVIWLDGKIHLLKEFVDPAFSGFLWSARSINDAGVITGRMYDADGNPHAYIATPIAAPLADAK